VRCQSLPLRLIFGQLHMEPQFFFEIAIAMA
jgi:hypothetical protein